MDILDEMAEFTWDFGNQFFVETATARYIWKDPDYGGDNTLTRTTKTYEQFINGSLGRDKGTHRIRDYCGSNVKVIDSKDTN